MLDDTLAALVAAPLWAQVIMVLFALSFVVMVVEPRVTHLRIARRFGALAAAFGATVKPGADAFAESFEVDQDGRPFTVRRELRQTGLRGSYRGPRGHLIISETPLAGSRWIMHNTDIAEHGALPLLGSRPLKTGDAAFDRRFTVFEDGVPGRDGWLDAETRAAVTSFFDATPLSGSLWVRSGVLQHAVVAPKGIDAAAMAVLLRAQAVVARTFEQTGGWRGPAA